MIVVLNGPPSVGKTQTAVILAQRFQRSVMVDLDNVGDIRPQVRGAGIRAVEAGLSRHSAPDLADDEAFGAARCLMEFHSGRGCRDFVVAGVIPWVSAMQALCRNLGEVSSPVLVYRLSCREEAVKKRIRLRSPSRPWSDFEGELEAWREYDAIFRTEAISGDLGREIDTSELNLFQVVDLIWKTLEDPVDP